MPTVYRVLPENNFQDLEPEDYEAFSAARKTTWKFDGKSVGGRWKPLEVYVRETTLKKPDVYALMHTFAFEEAAAKKVQVCLGPSCEQFRLPFEDRHLILINVTHVIDALDKKKSVFDPDLPHVIDAYAFRADRLDHSLFKIPQTALSDIYTVEGLGSPDEEFKPLVDKLGIKGLCFAEVWRSEEKKAKPKRK